MAGIVKAVSDGVVKAVGLKSVAYGEMVFSLKQNLEALHVI